MQGGALAKMIYERNRAERKAGLITPARFAEAHKRILAEAARELVEWEAYLAVFGVPNRLKGVTVNSEGCAV